MYCSTCGAYVPGHRSTCDTCGSAVGDRSLPATSAGDASAGAMPARIGTCPRCDYQGQGLPYFSRGPHVAGVIAATLFTLPWALGGGGIAYYMMRREYRICPRCGKSWGKLGEVARMETAAVQNNPERAIAFRGGSEGLQRAWSFILFALAVVLIMAGITELEIMAVVLGLVAGGGGFALHRNAGRLREERRAALISHLQQPVLKLAAEHGGTLTVTEVAASLGWTIRRAEKVLHSLDDGWRVSSEVTDDGVIVYEFRELRLRPGGEQSA